MSSRNEPWESSIFKPTAVFNSGMARFLQDDLELGLRVAYSLDVEYAETAQMQYWWLAVGNDMYDEMRREEEEWT